MLFYLFSALLNRGRTSWLSNARFLGETNPIKNPIQQSYIGFRNLSGLAGIY